MPTPWDKVADIFIDATDELKELPMFKPKPPPKEEYPFLKARTEKQGAEAGFADLPRAISGIPGEIGGFIGRLPGLIKGIQEGVSGAKEAFDIEFQGALAGSGAENRAALIEFVKTVGRQFVPRTLTEAEQKGYAFPQKPEIPEVTTSPKKLARLMGEMMVGRPGEVMDPTMAATLPFMGPGGPLIGTSLKASLAAIPKAVRVGQKAVRAGVTEARLAPERGVFFLGRDELTNRIVEVDKLLMKKGKLPVGEGTKEALRLERANLEAQKEVALATSPEDITSELRHVITELGNRSLPFHGRAKNRFPDMTAKQLEEMAGVYEAALATKVPPVAQALPLAEAGMPEAGLQTRFKPTGEITTQRFVPAGRGKPTQMSMDELARLEQAKAPPTGLKDPIESLSTMELEKRVGRATPYTKLYQTELDKRAIVPPPTQPPIGPPTPPGGAIPPPPTTPGLMGNLAPIDEVINIASRPDIWRTIVNSPGLRSMSKLFNPSAVAAKPVEHALIGRAVLRDQGQQLGQAAIAPLNAIGTQTQVFGALTKEGLLAEGPFKGLSVNTLRTYSRKYAPSMTQTQKDWIRAAAEVERSKLRFLKENGIPVRELVFEEGGEYAGRRVWAKTTKGGELLDAAYVGAGPGRPGAKLAAEKHRVFKTVEEAVAEGYHYLPDDEALYLNVSGAYNRVADKQMTDWLLTKVAWRTTGAPEELVLAAEGAKRSLNKSKQLAAALNRAVRGERIPDATINSIGVAYPEQAQALKALIPKLQAKAPQTAGEVQRLTQEAKGLMTQNELAWRKTVSARARAREIAMRPTFEEATLPAPAFAGKIFTGPEAKETARILREGLDPNFSNALGVVNQVNSVARYFMLAGDVSPMAIQLLFLAGGNPRVYGKAGAGLVKALFDTRFHAKYLAKPENLAIIQKYPNLILTHGGATEFTEAMARGGLLRKGPLKIAGKVLEPFQRGFEGALDVAGIEMAKAYDHLGTTAERIADLSQFINEFRGVTSSARLGVSVGMRQAETAAILAPRYNRAIAGLLFDLSRGNLRGELARKALARGVTAIAAMAVAISYARGEDFDQIVDHLNPLSPNFVTWTVGGQRIGPGTKVRSVIKLFAQTAANPGSLWNISQNTFMRSPGWRFIRGNLSPALSTGLDLLTGRDYIGDPTRDGLLSFTKIVGEKFMPIWVQTVALEGGDLSDRLIRGAGEFMGLRTYPEDVTWKLANEWKDELKTYNEIPTSAIERKEKGITITREKLRGDNSVIDAKLFITSEVSSLKTQAAVSKAVQLIRENEIDPKEIQGIKERLEKITEARKVGLSLEGTLVDNLIRSLGIAPPGTPYPKPSGRGYQAPTVPRPGLTPSRR